MRAVVKVIRDSNTAYGEYPKAMMTSRQMNNKQATINCCGIDDIQPIITAITKFADAYGATVTEEINSSSAISGESEVIKQLRLCFDVKKSEEKKEEIIVKTEETQAKIEAPVEAIIPTETKEESAKPIQFTTANRQDMEVMLTDVTNVVKSGTIEEIIMALTDVVKLHRRLTKPRKEQPVTVREDGITLIGHTVTIVCSDCSKEHVIKKQDAKQVKRCPVCQKKYRIAKRAEARKAKRAEAKAIKESK